MKLLPNLLDLMNGAFNVQVKPGRALITPMKSKYRWESWEIPYRSVIIDGEGKVLSTGLPKFFNFGEHGRDECPINLPFGPDVDLDELSKDYIIKFFKKADGSLIIRDVINGEVNFRTRGTFTFTNPPEQVREWKVLCREFPCLLDPEWYPDYSFFFEYTSPKNRIVLPYTMPTPYFIGGINKLHFGQKFIPACLFHDAYKIPAVEETEFTGTLNSIHLDVLEQTGIEGYVCWIYQKTTDKFYLVKFKTREYLELHRMRSMATPKNLSLIACARGAKTLSEANLLLADEGYDWEVLDSMQDELRDAVNYFGDCLDSLEVVLSGVKRFQESGASRKDFADMVKQTPKILHPIYFTAYAGKYDDLMDFVVPYLLSNVIPGVKSTEAESAYREYWKK